MNKIGRGFTLIELIVVIIIVGILAAVGISQYSKTVEKGRAAEAKMILGQIRQLLFQYRLENGTINGVTNNDVNIGASPNQIPGYPNCIGSYYFMYSLHNVSDPTISIRAMRCSGGGKSPQWSGTPYELWWNLNLQNDTVAWQSWWPDTGSYRAGW